jgi:hypothetical protein
MTLFGKIVSVLNTTSKSDWIDAAASHCACLEVCKPHYVREQEPHGHLSLTRIQGADTALKSGQKMQFIKSVFQHH